MGMPGRKYTAGSGYRYGFNGKENDNDAGEGKQDYGMRIYDIRLARFLSVDPIASSYPMLTPYQFASNSPNANLDEDGLEAVYYTSTIQFIQNYQAMPDGSTKTWSSQKILPGMPLHTGLTPNGPEGSGNLYTIQTQIVEKFYDINGIQQSECEETPSVLNTIYEKSRSDLMKDVKNRPMFEGKVQLIVYGNASSNEDSPGSQANPTAETYSINMEAFNEYVKPIMMGITQKTPMDYDGPTLENLASNNMKAVISKAEKTASEDAAKRSPNSTVCSMCEMGPHPQDAIDAYRTGTSGKVTDTLRKNDKTGKIDTIPTGKNN